MISDIYLMTFSMQKNYYDEEDFHTVILSEFPKYADHHIPKGASFKSIDYRKDALVSAFVEKIVSDHVMDIEKMIQKGLQIEIGVYTIKLDGPKDYTRCTLLGMEYLIQEMHTSYSFISSICMYLDEFGIKLFNRLFTFESDDCDTEGFDLELINSYSELFQSYFYQKQIADAWAGEAAKMLLMERFL